MTEGWEEGPHFGIFYRKFAHQSRRWGFNLGKPWNSLPLRLTKCFASIFPGKPHFILSRECVRALANLHQKHSLPKHRGFVFVCTSSSFEALFLAVISHKYLLCLFTFATSDLYCMSIPHGRCHSFAFCCGSFSSLHKSISEQQMLIIIMTIAWLYVDLLSVVSCLVHARRGTIWMMICNDANRSLQLSSILLVHSRRNYLLSCETFARTKDSLAHCAYLMSPYFMNALGKPMSLVSTHTSRALDETMFHEFAHKCMNLWCMSM